MPRDRIFPAMHSRPDMRHTTPVSDHDWHIEWYRGGERRHSMKSHSLARAVIVADYVAMPDESWVITKVLR
jgi:hypothetical protein